MCSENSSLEVIQVASSVYVWLRNALAYDKSNLLPFVQKFTTVTLKLETCKAKANLEYYCVMCSKASALSRIISSRSV